MCGSTEPTKHEPQTKFQKFTIRLQALIFFALSFYTIVSLFQALEQVTREDLVLSEKPPTDRCVPFFDDVVAFVGANNGTRAVFDYIAGEAITRICTNVSSADLRSAIGVQYTYDPWASQTGCDILGSDRQIFVDTCERVNFQADDPTDCAGILNITPLPFGAHWNMYAVTLSGNFTNVTTGEPTPYPRCTVRVTRIPSVPRCEAVTMEPFRQIDKNVAVLIYIGVAAPFVVTFLQCIALWQYSSTWSAEDGWKLSFACRGIPGGLYMFWWVCHEGDGGRGEFPDTFFNFWGWFACAFQDAFEGLVVPLTAIVGCQLTRFPVNLVLVGLKAAKFLFDFVMYIKNRNETSEPGSADEQRKVWMQNPDVTHEEVAAGLSLEGHDAQKKYQQDPSFPRPTPGGA